MKTLDTFYRECIDTRIAKCDLVAKANGRSFCTKIHAELRIAQATFLEDEKERLVEEMIRQGFGMELSRINAFLNESFFVAFRAGHYANAFRPDSGRMHQSAGYSL